MESQPQNPDFRNNPENFHPCIFDIGPDNGNIFSVNLKQNSYHQFNICCGCSKEPSH